MLESRESRGCLIIMVVILIATLNPSSLSAQTPPHNVRLGEDVTITEMNWNDDWITVPAPSNPGTLPPDAIDSWSTGNNAYTFVSTSASDEECQDGQSGNADALVGIDFYVEGEEGESGTAEITISFYSSAESEITGGGTADAILYGGGVEEYIHRAICSTGPGWSGPPCRETFSVDETITSSMLLEVGENYQVGLGVYSHADVCEGSNYASCDVTIHNVEIDFVPPPVLLIHGIWDDEDVWSRSGVKQFLQKNGYLTDASDLVHTINFCPNNGRIEDDAEIVKAKIAELADNVENPMGKIDIVAHSRGGLVVRYYLAHPELWPVNIDGHGVRKLIMLGTPNLGTDIHLLHPIFANYKEYDNNKVGESCPNNNYYDYPAYHFNIWSPALQQMTAIWKHPSGWKKEPMPRLERSIPELVIDSTLGEWIELIGLFGNPPFGPEPQVIFQNHKDYYESMIDRLTEETRFSPFLEDLNAAALQTDVEYYLICGTSVRLTIRPWFLLWPRFTLVSDYGDGVVPVPSALGSGLSFPPDTLIRHISSNHLDLPSRAKGLILEFLNN